MKRCRKLLLVFILSIATIVCSSCDRRHVKTNPTIDDGRIKIGFTFDTFVIERWERDRDIFVSRANELGADVNIQSANGDVEEQKKQIEYFIEQDMDVIVIVPVDCGTLADEVKAAKDRGIKVISYDRLIENADVDLYISFDNSMVGKLMGQSLADDGNNENNIIMVSGPTTDGNVIMVDEGFTEIAEGSGYNIVDVTYIDGWKQELAYDYISENKDTVKKANVIMCGNDALAGQVILALQENNMADDYVVLGQDADLDACQRIVEGTQYMTVYKPIDELANSAADCAIKLAQNEKLDFTAKLNNGKNYIDYIAIKPVAVTKKNMDSVIIDGGFHLKDEVYLNVKK